MAGFYEIVINVSWLAEKIKKRLGDGSRYRVHIRYSEEPQGALETGGGILQALPLLGADPFLVVSSDMHTDFPFANLKTVLTQEDLAHLVMVPNPSHHREGDFVLDAKGRLHADGQPRLTYAGIGVHRPEFFSECLPGRFPMLPWWQRAMRAGRMSGELYAGDWQDIGTLESLRALSALNIDS